MIHFSDRELVKAFKLHAWTAKEMPNPSQHTHIAKNVSFHSQGLLLCYAVECGLKAAYLKRHQYHGTDRAKNDLKTHNIQTMLEDLHASAWLIKSIPQSLRLNALQNSPPKPRIVGPGTFHEMFRYGGLPEHRAEINTLIETLEKVIAWLHQELAK